MRSRSRQEVAPVPRYRFEQYFATRRLSGSLPSPDGESVYFVTDISGQFNLWRVKSSGGWPQQLTLFERETVRMVAVDRAGRQVAFAADADGTEQHQLFLMEAGGGWPEPLTSRSDVQYSLSEGAFSPDGRFLAYSANARVAHEVDVYLRDLATGEERQVCGGGIFYFDSFSPDGRWLLVAQLYSNMDQDLWLVDRASGQCRNLTAHPGSRAKFFPGWWQPAGQGFYFVTDQGRDFLGLAYFSLADGRWQYVVTPDWDVEAGHVSGDGRWLAYVVNAAGNSVLHVRCLETGEELPLPDLPRGVINGCRFAPRDERRRLFLQMSTYRQSGAVFVLDLEQGEVRQVTEAMLGNLPDEAFVAPELVQVRSFDGLTVPAWLYRPPAAGPVPAVLAIHGGPDAQERPGYNYGGFYQYLLSRGIAVLAPNIRGSTGFGSTYQQRIYRDWGGAELRDIDACARYLKALDWVDPGRVGVWGGSFGGFATLSAASRLPDLWACACDFCGPSNLITFVRSVPPHWQAMMKSWVGDADEDRELLLERSPITHVEQIRCPLMVVQGANDPRVIKAESDQIVERLRALGRQVEYLVFEDEGHGFAKRKNQFAGYAAMAGFLVRHLTAD